VGGGEAQAPFSSTESSFGDYVGVQHFVVVGIPFSLSTRAFAGKTAFVAGCGDREEPYKALPLADRTPDQVASSETHCGCPLKA